MTPQQQQQLTAAAGSYSSSSSKNSVRQSGSLALPEGGGGWAPSLSQQGSSSSSLGYSGINSGGGPIWPSRNNLLPPTDQPPQLISNSNGFEPSRPLRFPGNRRTDEEEELGGGVGEVSLVTGPELARTTALGGFGAAVSPPGGQLKSEIANRVDISSGEEFVVGASLAMGGSSHGRLENSLAGLPAQQGKLQ